MQVSCMSLCITGCIAAPAKPPPPGWAGWPVPPTCLLQSSLPQLLPPCRLGRLACAPACLLQSSCPQLSHSWNNLPSPTSSSTEVVWGGWGRPVFQLQLSPFRVCTAGGEEGGKLPPPLIETLTGRLEQGSIPPLYLPPHS